MENSYDIVVFPGCHAARGRRNDVLKGQGFPFRGAGGLWYNHGSGSSARVKGLTENGSQ